jgi:hypothetical protein
MENQCLEKRLARLGRRMSLCYLAGCAIIEKE